jgi:hypothetical protein
MNPPSTKERTRKRPSNLVLNCLSVLVGVATFAAGLAWLIYKGTPISGIPFVICVPVVAAVAFRNCWD